MNSTDSTLLDFDPAKGEWDGEYRMAECRRALRPSDMRQISDYALDPYGGCENGCIYCYRSARCDPLQRRVVAVHPDIPDRLARELPAVRGSRICIGSASDGYQYAERRFLITRRCLEVLAASGNPVTVMTKSDLAARDADLLMETGADVLFSVTSLGRRESLMAEPGAPLPEARLKAMSELSRKGVRVGAMVFPATSMLSGKEKDLAGALVSAGAGSVFIGGLCLRHADGDLLARRGIEDSPETLRRIEEECLAAGLHVRRLTL